MNHIMNASGKFVAPVRYYSNEKNATSAPESMPKPPASLYNVDVVIPECPTCKPTLMELVRHYFGSLWWLWLIVVILIISKEGE